MNDLALCLSCSRHARPGPACPFCGAALPNAARPRRVTAASRAAIFAVALGAAACGDTEAPDDAAVADSGSDVDSGNDVDAGGEVDAGPVDAGNVAMPYGAPPVDHLV